MRRSRGVERSARPEVRPPESHRPLPPLYYRVWRTLEQRIRDQSYRAGERLPSEDRLCSEFRASRITIRQALARLVDQGLVVRRRGSGSFVSPQAETRLTAPAKFTASLEDLFAQVERVRTKSAEIVEEVPPPDVRAVLQIPAGEALAVVRRVRVFREQPFSVTTNYLPREVGARLAEAELYRYPLLRLLEEKLRVVFRSADQTIEARLADEDVAKALGIHFGDPVLFVERLMFTDADRPFELVRSHYRADVYRYQIRLTRSRKAPFRWRVGADREAR